MIQWGVSRVLKKGVAMTQIKIDRHAKTMELELELEGESTPIRIKVDRYSFESSPSGDATISATGIHISRNWMQLLAATVMEGKKLPVPPDIAKFAGLIL